MVRMTFSIRFNKGIDTIRKVCRSLQLLTQWIINRTKPSCDELLYKLLVFSQLQTDNNS